MFNNYFTSIILLFVRIKQRSRKKIIIEFLFLKGGKKTDQKQTTGKQLQKNNEAQKTTRYLHKFNLWQDVYTHTYNISLESHGYNDDMMLFKHKKLHYNMLAS